MYCVAFETVMMNRRESGGIIPIWRKDIYRSSKKQADECMSHKVKVLAKKLLEKHFHLT